MIDRTLLTGRADVHIHTTASDGFASIHQILGYIARKQLLDVIAITDHDVMDASLWAYDHRANYPFEIIPGVEVTSAEGHVLALWVTQPIPKGLSLKETVDAIHEQGGMAILAHPFELIVCPDGAARYLVRPSAVQEAGVDAIEIHNAGAMTPGNNILARRLARRLGLPTVGNSDAHSLEAIGRGITRFQGKTAADFRQAVWKCETTVVGTSWPLRDYARLLHSKLAVPGVRSTRMQRAES